jgi:hypothetical protein
MALQVDLQDIISGTIEEKIKKAKRYGSVSLLNALDFYKKSKQSIVL